MSLQFIIGRAGSGKSTFCLDEIRARLIEQPQGDPLLYLVPDQMTFQAEYSLVTSPHVQGMIRVQAFSFSRLAFRILQEVGGISRYHLNRVGVTMILRKIIENRKNELKIFQRATDQNGFFEHLEQMVTEFKRYCLSPEQILVASGENLQDSPVLLDKLHDLQLIFAEFEHYMLGKYVDTEDYLRLLVEKIPESSYLKQAEIWVDGFHQFTPQELEVLQSLIKHCPKVHVALTLDQPYDDERPHSLDLFYFTAKTYQLLKEMAVQEKVKIEEPILLSKDRAATPMRYKGQPSLAHLEASYALRPIRPCNGETAVHLAAAVNRRAEVEGVARNMIQQVREQGYRWRDMAILVGDLNIYHDLLETVFQDYGIPIFLDQKRSMLHHPLIEFIRSCLDVLSNNWRYEAIFRCLKTDLLFTWEHPDELRLLREELDHLENYVLAYGMNGAKWTQAERWIYQHSYSLEQELSQTDEDMKKEQRLNEIRKMIVQPLGNLHSKLSSASTIRDYCEALYLFLEELQIPRKLEIWCQQAEEEGVLQQSREHDQVWTAVVELFDQLVEMLGEEEVSLDLFSKLIETGCESLRFSLVPPAMDQVLVGTIERSRFSHLTCTYILGANDGLLPAKPQHEGIMTEGEREQLSQLGIELAPHSQEQLALEEFYIYVALSSASNQLWVSHALADEEGKSLTPSMIIKRLKQLFPSVKEQLIVQEIHENGEDQQIEYVANPQKTLSHLATQLRQWKKGYAVAPFWWDVYNWFAEQKEWQPLFRRISSSLFYHNVARKLSSETSQALYGKHLKTSVSRMEKYKSCPFAQFLSHGLRLKERAIYRLEAPDIGQLFHAALKLIDDYLREQDWAWKDLTKADCERLAREVVEKLAPRLQGQILLSSNRHYYIKRKLSQVVERATTVISKHSKQSEFTPVGLEIEFGNQGSLPAIQFSLKNGVTMEVIGRIDRVDRAESDKGLYLRVIDYKSSDTRLNLSEVFHGLSLQMLTYLDVIITHSKQWLGVEATPAGVLYFHIHNPLLNQKTALPDEQLEQELFKRFKMKGYVLAQKQVAQLMDTTLESSYSEVIPVRLKKDGGFDSRSTVANEEDFSHLRGYVRQQIQEIGEQISEGMIPILPYKLKNKVACTFCPYKPVCQFDQELEQNQFLQLPATANQKVLEIIRMQGRGKNNERDT